MVIPARDQWALTERALAAIADHTAAGVPYEVILGDDGSTDGTLRAEQQFPGVHRVVNDTDRHGFLHNSNHAASSARGDVLVLLNNDTEVQPGWLEPLLDVFERHPNVGIVGPKLIYAGGALQEAGCTLYRDGRSNNCGRFSDPAAGEFSLERVVDYVSGACLAIRRALWMDIGGFDPRYAPAYYEDADLAFEAWKRGWGVVYQPRSVVMHLDGGSMKASRERMLRDSREAFRDKWQPELTRCPRVPLGVRGKPIELARSVWRKLPLSMATRKRMGAALGQLRSKSLEPRPRERTSSRGRVTVAGFLESGRGLGEAARLDVLALHELGFLPARVDVSDALGTRDLPNTSFETTLVPEGGPLLLRVNPPELPTMLAHLGSEITSGRKIVGCWSWELPKAPNDWHAGFQHIDELWVPSEYCARAFRDVSPVPVVVVPHPVRVPPSAGCSRADFGLANDKVVFLSMSDMRSSFERKNLLGAVKAFKAAFENDDSSQLLLKVHHVEDAPANLDALRRAIGNAPNVRLVSDFMPSPQVGDLLRSVDVFLSPHRAEGFGLVLAEAMLLGKAVIATEFSGNVDFMPRGTAELLQYCLIAAKDPTGIYDDADQLWAQPDFDEMVDAIRRLATSEERRKELGDAAREHARAHFSAESFGRHLPQWFVEQATPR